jgi:hypothetical protein
MWTTNGLLRERHIAVLKHLLRPMTGSPVVEYNVDR